MVRPELGTARAARCAEDVRAVQAYRITPEVLIDALGALEERIAEVTAESVDELFNAAVNREIQASELDALHVVDSLTPLQGAVLRVMAVQGDN